MMEDAPRRPARIGIVSPGSGRFDSRAHRIARSCVARGDTVTIYARRELGMPAEEHIDGYRVVRVPLQPADVREPVVRETDPIKRVVKVTILTGRRIVRRIQRTIVGQPVIHRMARFPWRPWTWGSRLASVTEPHDIWHGMWAGSLPALERVRARHGGRTIYDSRDVYLRSRDFAGMRPWQHRLLAWFESRWARSADAVITVNDSYARILADDLHIPLPPVIRNCPDRWEPPTPRPDLIRARLGLPATTRIVLYQGHLLTHRGIEQSMDAILEVPDAVLVLMGIGKRERFADLVAGPTYAGKVFFLEPVPPQELLIWTASSDVMVMAIQPNSDNHQHTTPQKLWEAMAAGVPVVASDMPGMASVVRETGCGEVCDPTSPASIASAIGRILDGGPDAVRAMGDRGLAAAHDRYNWEVQAQVLDGVYGRLLASSP